MYIRGFAGVERNITKVMKEKGKEVESPGGWKKDRTAQQDGLPPESAGRPQTELLNHKHEQGRERAREAGERTPR